MKAARACSMALGIAVLCGLATPVLAHQPILKCVLIDQNTVRCRGGTDEGDPTPGATIEVIDHAGRTLISRKVGTSSVVTFPRPAAGYYVLFDVGPGYQAIVEHDEIRAPRRGYSARWIRP